MIKASALLVAFVAVMLSGCGHQTAEDSVASARRHMAKSEYQAAIIELKNALQKNPKYAEARVLLGSALIEAGDPAGAEIELRRALELEAAPKDVSAPLARALVGLGQYKKVIDQFSGEDLGAAELQADLLTSLGHAQFGLRRIDDAQREFTKALALRPTFVPALLGSARVKLATRDLPGALASVRAALDADPKSVAAMHFEADLLVASGRLDDALAAYRRALAASPKSIPANVGIIGILIDQDKLDDAAKQLATLKQMAPKRPETFYMHANYEYRRKNVAAARQWIQQYLGQQPEDLRGHFLAAAIEFEGKAHDKAEEHLLRVLAIAPNATPARRLLVTNHLRSGKQSEAIEALRPLLPVGTTDPTNLALAGETYLVGGDANKAEVFFAKASQLDPTDERKLTGLALSHLAQGRVDDAFRELEQASAIDKAGRADVAMFNAAMRQNDYARALAAADALEKKQPTKPLAHNLRGLALLAKRDFAAARSSFEGALKLDPSFFPAVANLARVDLLEQKPEVARKRFDSWLAKNPNSAPALLAIAELQRRNKDKPEDVAATISKAIAAEPNYLTARLALVHHYLRLNDPKRASTAAQDALAAFPDSPELLEVAGVAQLATRNANQAVATFTKWVQLRPKSHVALLRLAEAQIANKDDVSAERNLRRALELKPDYLDGQRRLASLDVRNDRVDRALATAKKVQAQRPKESAGYLLEGDIHAMKKAWAPALAAYRTGLKQVDSVDLAIRHHAILGASQQKGEADSFAAARLKQHPDETAFRIYLAEYSLAARDYATASNLYQSLVTQQPDNAMWLNNLAWAASKMKDPKALEYAEKADRLRPNDPAILDTLGVLLIDKGETAKGVKTLREAVKLAPNRPDIRLNLAKGLITDGNKDAARKELLELSKLGNKFGNHAEVERLLKETGS